MTRKHYEALARALRDERPDEPGSCYDHWATTVLAIAKTLRDLSGYDLNGNRRFDWDRFCDAAGLAR